MSAATALADRLMLGLGESDPGITYARRTEHAQKHMARNEVVSLFGPRAWPDRLSILTMPSLGWSFERALINCREHGKAMNGGLTRRTYITAIERNPAVYYAALKDMPGADASLDCRIACPSWAGSVVRTLPIPRFYNCSLTDYVGGIGEAWPAWHFDAAWIDLTGPVTESTIDAFEALWERGLRLLIVTSLKARWAQWIGERIREAGGLTDLLLDVLPYSVPLVEREYRDRSPMHQVALRRIAA